MKPSRDEWNAAIRNLEGNSTYYRFRSREWYLPSKKRKDAKDLEARAVQLERVIAYMKQHKPYLKRQPRER